jgi:hypothetical protein
MSDLPHANTEREPLEILLSSGNRIALSTELTTRIWEAVERGEYSGPQEYIDRTLREYLDNLKQPEQPGQRS